jgi:hypothetical protein
VGEDGQALASCKTCYLLSVTDNANSADGTANQLEVQVHSAPSWKHCWLVRSPRPLEECSLQVASRVRYTAGKVVDDSFLEIISGHFSRFQIFDDVQANRRESPFPGIIRNTSAGMMPAAANCRARRTNTYVARQSSRQERTATHGHRFQRALMYWKVAWISLSAVTKKSQ